MYPVKKLRVVARNSILFKSKRSLVLLRNFNHGNILEYRGSKTNSCAYEMDF